MKIGDKQHRIILCFQGDYDKQLTLAEIERLSGIAYFNNTRHYISQSITGLVKRKLLIRVSRGVYKLGKGAARAGGQQNPNQLALF